MKRENLKSKGNRWGKKALLSGLAVIGALALFLSNVDNIISFVNKQFSKKGIHIVEISFRPTNHSGRIDTVDIKLRNNGNEISVLKKIKLSIHKKWEIKPIDTYAAGGLLPSANYDLVIDCEKVPPYILEVDISQEIQSNSADRFFLSLQNSVPTLSSIIFLADISFEFNESKSLITKPNLLFGFFNDNSIYTNTKIEYSDLREVILNHQDPNELYLFNLKQIEEINKTKAEKSKPLVDFIKNFKK